MVTALGFDKTFVVAHDIGNMVAYAYAAMYLDKVERLVVMDAPIPGIEPWNTILLNPGVWQRFPDSTQVGHDDCVVFHQVGCQRRPRVAVLGIPMKKYDHSPSSSPAHKDVRSFGAMNRFRLKAGGQGRLRVTESRRKGENCKGETMSDHYSSVSERSGLTNGKSHIWAAASYSTRSNWLRYGQALCASPEREVATAKPEYARLQ